MEEPIELEALFPDRGSAEPLASQLTRRLRSAIENGFFPAGARILPSRELAKRLGLARNTVIWAIEQLIAEGYLEARVGAGTYVTATPAVGERAQVVSRPPKLPTHTRDLLKIAAQLEAVGDSRGPLRIGAPALDAFPHRAWERLARRHARTIRTSLDYDQASGTSALREAISRHIAQFRGVVADPNQVIIVEGTQGGLALAALVLSTRGDAIAIEDPCYQLARTVFTAFGLVLRGVRADECGIRTNALPRSAALAYVSPSHQFPLGGALPLERRLELLEWARQRDAYVIEDDYDSEFCARPLPALQSLDRGERVIYVGTFSKTLAPGLRLGYIVAPRHLAHAFRFARAAVSLGASGFVQAIMADFIAEGHFSRHVRRMTALYDQRRRTFVEALSRELAPAFRIGAAQTGLHVAIIAPPGFDDVSAVASLPQEHRVLALSQLCVERADLRGVLAGFSSGSAEAIARAARDLATTLRSQIAPPESATINADHGTRSKRRVRRGPGQPSSR
jgi:GntR family transcriptional regulator / MocR family aminotransferase